MSVSLGEQKMLWEHELTGECFHSIFEFSQTFTSVYIRLLYEVPHRFVLLPLAVECLL